MAWVLRTRLPAESGSHWARNSDRGFLTKNRGISSASSIGQSRYSTTLLLDGGRLFRVANHQPSGLAVQIDRYSLKTFASASARVTGAALALALCGLSFSVPRRAADVNALVMEGDIGT